MEMKGNYEMADTLIEEIKTVISVKMHEFFAAGYGGCDVSSWTDDFAQKLHSLQKGDIPVNIEKAVFSALCNEPERLKNLDIQWDVADVMKIIAPFLKRESVSTTGNRGLPMSEINVGMRLESTVNSPFRS
jgi:hypothetical protein